MEWGGRVKVGKGKERGATDKDRTKVKVDDAERWRFALLPVSGIIVAVHHAKLKAVFYMYFRPA